MIIDDLGAQPPRMGGAIILRNLIRHIPSVSLTRPLLPFISPLPTDLQFS